MPDDLLRMLEEMDPGIEFCTLRCAEDEVGDTATHVECRFGDGQKYAPVVVDDDCPKLARLIETAINGHHALLDVLRAADAMRNSVYGGAYLRSLQLEYDAARARFAQAIKEGKS